jgi:hypothetical protein
MAGDPSNARQWVDADVYIAFDTSTANPANIGTVFGSGWELVGLLDGDQGFVESRDEDVTDHFAWGKILMRTSRRNFKLSRKFTAFETNAVTRRLRWPGSDAGQIVVPVPERVKIAFETRDGDMIHRVISAYEAEVTIDGDVTENEGDMSSLAFMVNIYPDGDGVLFVEQQTA